ncbi:hypothetical protein L3X38_037669 [Prunus dulcis]|uniref:Uncharacterized protein n=1 Tax=Prunus dulcis TaxID=3755 RepID=A0AAD4YPS1_PRUDU|nr:hypothetical protein L3X38_037669 [Prunus dulcis]
MASSFPFSVKSKHSSANTNMEVMSCTLLCFTLLILLFYSCGTQCLSFEQRPGDPQQPLNGKLRPEERIRKVKYSCPECVIHVSVDFNTYLMRVGPYPKSIGSRRQSRTCFMFFWTDREIRPIFGTCHDDSRV